MNSNSITHFVLNNWYLFLALVVIVYLLLAEPVRRLMYGIQSIPPSQAVQLINHHAAVIVDVRDPKEFQSGHIRKALNFPLSDLSKQASELEKFKDKSIVLYCGTGQRSAQAATFLRRQGFGSVHNLAGGISRWRTENLPVTLET
ncbi:MAG TPA: rhodanese-like domain-containing protein [Acidiferrobacterales bacterium]|nr:rhodanese-like domain-containing protein [Acidiferrobacterales bacterium]